jgi:hypothetical protein
MHPPAPTQARATWPTAVHERSLTILSSWSRCRGASSVGMKRLVVIATLAAAVVSLGVLAALVARPSPARSVPAIELVGPSTSTSPPTTTGGTHEETAPGRPSGQDGPTASSRSSGRGGASPAPAPQPAPAGDDADDGGDDGNDDDGGGDDDGGDD